MRIIAIWTVFSVLLLSWMGTRYIQSWDSCLTGSYVKTIIIGDEKATINQCHLADRLFSLTNATNEQKKWVRKIRATEDLWPALKSKVKPVVIDVKEKDPFYYSVNASVISLGGQMIRSQGLLEKALLESWLMQVNPHADRYSLDVFSDVLSSMVRTSDEWQDPTTGEMYRLSQSYWPEQLTTFADYCLSAHKSPSHILFCANQEQSREGLNVWTTKQMLSGLIYEFASQLSLQEREQLIQRLPTLEIPEFPKNSTRVAYYVWIQKILNSTFQDNVKLAGYIEQQRKQKGLQDDVVIPLVIHFDDEAIDPNRFTKLIEWSTRKPGKSVAISTEGQLHLLPDFNTLNLKSGEWKARRILWVSCAMPTTEQILNIHADKVTAMKVCPGDKNVDWERLMVSDIEEFLLHHEDVSYFEVHVPSLQLAVSTGMIRNTKQTIDKLLQMNLSATAGFGNINYVSHPIAFLTKYRM